jgi:hypothetical protein
MKNVTLLLGIVLLVAGGVVVSGLIKWQETEKVVDIGPLEINKTEEKSPPLNLGWVLLGAGAVALVAGAMMKK